MIVPSAILITHLRGLTIATGLNIGILAVVCAIVGGVGSLTGAIFGAMLFAVSQSMSNLVIDAGWQEAVGYGVLLSLILVRPAGLLSAERKV
jgi:branched-subunit amino acid ABC-type transport system permease component